jgi:hypothetical protein
MIFLFSLSQMSSLVVSLFNYNKDYVSIISEEETEKEEGESLNSDDHYYFITHTFNSISWILKEQLYAEPDTRIITSYSHKPETPPPDFC